MYYGFYFLLNFQLQTTILEKDTHDFHIHLLNLYTNVQLPIMKKTTLVKYILYMIQLNTAILLKIKTIKSKLYYYM